VLYRVVPSEQVPSPKLPPAKVKDKNDEPTTGAPQSLAGSPQNPAPFPQKNWGRKISPGIVCVLVCVSAARRVNSPDPPGGLPKAPDGRITNH
jgi:hypothetical protein